MPRQLNDIKKDPDNAKIDLKGDSSPKKTPIKKKKNSIYKNESPIREVKDLSGTEKAHFSYIKGEKFTPPKYLGNLLKIGGIGFLIILFINAMNVYVIGKSIERDISSKAEEGYNFLIDAGKSATKIEFDRALDSFNNALENFEEAEDSLWFVNTDQTFYAKDGNVGQAVNALLESGKHFATAGKYFLEAVEEFNNIPVYFVSKNNEDNSNGKNPSITDSLSIGLEKTDLAIAEITEAAEIIGEVNAENLPPEVRARVTFAQNKITEVALTLQTTSEHFPAILKLLGDRYPHRYLVLFQNNNEIRPTGGFIGSYAIVDINDGYIEKLETHDVYDLDGSYHGVIEPPEEFLKFTGNWRFRDSNYSPDFPTSAKKARWFLEKEGGPTADTVIAINQGLLADMLEITGPVQVGQFGKLDSKNYNLLLSYIIEGKVWGAEDPKHILKVFVPAFKEAIMKEEHISSATSKLYKAMQQKHILAYSADEDIQNLFVSMGISGEAYSPEEDEDYLSVINIATGGTKSEQFMEEQIYHDTHISDTGKITDKITIQRTHQWSDNIYLEWKKTLEKYGFTHMPDSIIDILGRGENKVSTRIYVPAGSKLIDTNGTDVATKYDNDLKKTYFFTEMNTKADDTSLIWIEYELPFNLDLDPASTYKMITEKQPGSRGSIFTKTLTTDDEVYSLATYPEEVRINADETISYATNLVYDKYFSVVLGQE
ncbi:DUF4012 domain-containing protein [Candidatus Peregrinibacteria bacterium]|jgi:hypothetical protein|nr:DUF4012 domain-containing protein [Candidatus Peregrinibacteria bacterium]MBT7736890.1 DUF4012 domain-containing protein [Candidatus Peregrinibacteria bacterium]